MAYKFKERLFYFLDNGYWHGIRFLGSRCQIVGRLFWFTVIVTSGLGMAVIFQFTLQNFQQDVINVNVETSFLHWTNTFPAISICLTKGLSATKVQHFLKAYWAANNMTLPKSDIAFALWVREYMFVSPNVNVDENEYCEKQNRTCGFDVNTLKEMFLPRKCSEFMTDLTFLGRKYDCDDIFKPLNTEMGRCFTANSLHIYKKASNLPLIYDQSDKNRVLNFIYNEKSDVFKILMYIHSPEELPYFDMEPIFLHKFTTQHYFIQTIEIVNSNDVRLEPIDQRNCRFPDERMDNSVLIFPTDCFLDIRFFTALALGNCLGYIFFSGSEIEWFPISVAKNFDNLTFWTTNKYLFRRLVNLWIPPTAYREIGKFVLNDREENNQMSGLREILKVFDLDCGKKTLFPPSDPEIPDRIKKNYKSSVTSMCIQSCIEMEINNLGEIIQLNNEKTEQTVVNVEVANTPTLRYVRNVTKTKLDFVVSIGGLVGLFFGASLLSLVELAYIWLIRRF